MNKFLLSVSLCFTLGFGDFVKADTLTVMHYNLMYYDKEYDDCNSTTNNVDNKDSHLRIILNYIQPDIFTANEINSSVSSVERIKTNALNVIGTTKYKRANFSGSFLSNMIYYNSDKVELKQQSTISTSPRITDVYKLFVKNPALANGDTIFLTCIVTHLKAGNTESDASQRATAANSIMNYIANNNITGNILLMGDMNLYTSTEGAFIKFTSPNGSSGFRFLDPINMSGAWNNNSYFKTVHTQSTNSSSDPCFSSGGMDDRFDFILSSSDVINGTNGLKYFNYKTIAQDGNRFNQSLISPVNNSVPTEVLNSLYNMSDHLPVQMKITYSSNTSGISTNSDKYNITYNNPIKENLRIRITNEKVGISKVTVYSLLGQKIHTSSYPNFSSDINISTSDFNDGILIVEILLTDGYRKLFKVIK